MYKNGGFRGTRVVRPPSGSWPQITSGICWSLGRSVFLVTVSHFVGQSYSLVLLASVTVCQKGYKTSIVTLNRGKALSWHHAEKLPLTAPPSQT